MQVKLQKLLKEKGQRKGTINILNILTFRFSDSQKEGAPPTYTLARRTHHDLLRHYSTAIYAFLQSTLIIFPRLSLPA